ncbi:alpha/beta hydrolase [Botryobacter ruber]|uniref:alpha/beta hydrolase n=1 Tax=Botryobacter ruber TaxID=2171629 RepID=UPI000E0BF789|nr:alpha/beta hydrolase [Botryobacter ruber]
MTGKASLLFTCFLFTILTSVAQQKMPLYPDGKVPNAIAAPATKATAPNLTVYLPSKDKATGTAVIICPGGGYRGLVMKREGHDVAAEFNKMGVAAFVLEYRLPSDATMKDKSIGPLQDAQQAIKTVRQRATEWNINPNKIGILGFSAGGHLASTAGTHFKREVIENKEHISLRPDFMILVYPVISFSDSLAHMGSRENLIGTSPTPEMIKLYSNELQVTPQTPPTFLVHAGDDSKVVVANSLRFYEALLKKNVPAEMHLYPKGEHGFSKGAPIDNWLERVRYWMIGNGWTK